MKICVPLSQKINYMHCNKTENMYCLQNSYERSRSLPRIMLACCSVFALGYDKMSLTGPGVVAPGDV